MSATSPSKKNISNATIVWITFSIAFALGMAFPLKIIVDQHYLGQGLFKLSVILLAAYSWPFALIGLGSALIAVAIRKPLRAILNFTGNTGRRLYGLTLFLVCFLPVGVWTAYQYKRLHIYDHQFISKYTGLLMLILLAILLYFAIVSPLKKSGFFARFSPRSRNFAFLSGAILVGLLIYRSFFLFAGGQLSQRPNVLVIVLDTVRPERLSCYTPELGTTPEIDRLAGEGILFTDAYSTSSWTVPSHASLFTGVLPVVHRATQENPWLADRFPILPELLRNAGYHTWAASTNPAASPLTNMGQGFEEFELTWYGKYTGGKEHKNNVAFRRFLKHADRERPFFAFLNYVDAHFPYVPSPENLVKFLKTETDTILARKIGSRYWTNYFTTSGYSEKELKTLSELYNGEVADLSKVVGYLLEELKADGRYDNTLIVLTSDHGEQFGEHNLIDHVFGLYNTTVKIPLIVRLPSGTNGGSFDNRSVQLTDLFPTLLGKCGVDFSSRDIQGKDLFSEITENAEREILSEYYFPSWVLKRFKKEDMEKSSKNLVPYLRRLRAIQKDGYRFIWSSNGKHEFYNLNVDPGETVNLYDSENPPDLARSYLATLESEFDRLAHGLAFEPIPDLAELLPGLEENADQETLKTLRSLGYVK